MKKRSFMSLFLVLALVMSLGLAGCSKGGEEPAPSDEVFELSFATFSNQGGQMDLMVETPLKEKLEKYSDGRIKVTIYYSGALAAGDGIYDALLSGAADMGHFCTADYTGTFPLSSLFDAPGQTFNSSASASSAYYDWVMDKGSAEYAEIYPLTVWAAGPNSLLTNKPIQTVADFKGMQISATGAMAPLLQAVDAIPVTLKFDELYEGMRLNMFDGMVMVPVGLVDFNLAEVTKYCTKFPLIGGSGLIAMNKDVYASMPEDLQKIVDQASREVFEEGSRDYFDSQNQTALEATMAKNPDFKYFEFSDADLATLVAQGDLIIDAKAKEMDAQGLAGSESLAWIRDKTKEYNAEFAK